MSGEACGTVGRQSHGFLSLDQPFTVHYAHSIPFLSLRLRVADGSEAPPNATLRSATRRERKGMW